MKLKVRMILKSAKQPSMVRVLVLLLCASWQIRVCCGQTTDPATGGAQSSEAAKQATSRQDVKDAPAGTQATLSASGQSTNSQSPVSPSVTLTWVASVSVNKRPYDPVLGYNVYRGTNSPPDYTKPIAFVAVKDTTYVDVNVERGKKYSYTVKTVTAKGESVASNQADADLAAH